MVVMGADGVKLFPAPAGLGGVRDKDAIWGLLKRNGRETLGK